MTITVKFYFHKIQARTNDTYVYTEALVNFIIWNGKKMFYDDWHMVSWLVEEITHLVVFNPYPYELNKCLHTYYSCTLPIVYMFLTSLLIDVCARFWKENGPDNKYYMYLQIWQKCAEATYIRGGSILSTKEERTTSFG